MKGLKTGGRQKGSINKATEKIKFAFAMLLQNNLDRLQEDFDQLKPIERLRLMADLKEFFIPKLTRIEADHNHRHFGVTLHIHPVSPNQLTEDTDGE